MHIGFITSEYPTTSFLKPIGGIGTFTKSIAEKLIQQKCNVTIFIHSQEDNRIQEENGITLHFVKAKRSKGLTWYVNRKYFNNYVNRIVKKETIDVLEAPDWTGFTAFMKFSCPLVIRLHGSDTFFCQLDGRKVKWKNHFYEKRAIKNADAIVGVSKYISQKSRDLFNLKSVPKTIYNAIDAEIFKPKKVTVIENSILYFGTIIRKKGVLELAKIFNKLIEINPKIVLTLLGKDVVDLREGISTLELFKKNLSPLAKQNICHVNSVQYIEVQNYIEQAEVIVLPSLAESFGMVVIESMSLEKAVIASNTGWNEEIIENNHSGILVSPIEHEKFAKKINTLLHDKEKQVMIGKNARLRVKKQFNLDITVKENIAFYKTLI